MIAGEPSGDQLGQGLIRALRARVPDVQISGVGGDAMGAENFVSLFPMDEISLMGVLPVLANLRNLLKRIDQTAKAVIAARPDALVLIDSPDFTHRVARRVRKVLPGLKIVNYVGPTVWAWRPGRAKRMRAYVDLILAIFPFEPEAHVRLGGPRCLYIGHPLIERQGLLQGDDEAKRAARSWFFRGRAPRSCFAWAARSATPLRGSIRRIPASTTSCPPRRAWRARSAT